MKTILIYCVAIALFAVSCTNSSQQILQDKKAWIRSKNDDINKIIVLFEATKRLLQNKTAPGWSMVTYSRLGSVEVKYRTHTANKG